MFDVNLVHTFVAVAKTKHFGKAAELLNATQPGVSQHLLRLEGQLGIKLVDRTKRSVELTAAGQVFLEHTHRLLPILARMEEDARKVSEGQMGEIHLGFSSSIIYSDVPQRIAGFSKQAPEIGLQYRVQSADELKSLLDWGEIDAIVTTLPMSARDYLSVPISKQAMGIAIHSNHPLANRSEVTLQDFRDEPFIVVPRERHPRNHDALISRFRDIGATLNISAYDTSFPNVLARVAMGQGAAHIALGYQGAGNEAVRVLNLKDPLLAETPIYAVARHDNLPKPTQMLIDYLSGTTPNAGTRSRRKRS